MNSEIYKIEAWIDERQITLRNLLLAGDSDSAVELAVRVAQARKLCLTHRAKEFTASEVIREMKPRKARRAHAMEGHE